MKTDQTTNHRSKPVRKATVDLGHADVAATRPVSNAVMILCVLGYLIWLILQPREAFKGLFATMAWLSVLFAMIRLSAVFTSKPKDHGLATLSEDLPIYTVLVPLFHEQQMVAQIMRGLDALRYPRDKLDIILITEEVDPLTSQTVARALRPPFRQIVVPKGTPQTKPRALNYALQSSMAAFVTIYDAEDRPHPDQLLAAIAAFQARPDWAAVQAPL